MGEGTYMCNKKLMYFDICNLIDFSEYSFRFWKLTSILLYIRVPPSLFQPFWLASHTARMFALYLEVLVPGDLLAVLNAISVHVLPP